MRVAVTGADGQLGHELCRQLGDRALPVFESDVDITSRDAVMRAVRQLAPDVLVNTAAYTNVDGAETNVDRCMGVNVAGTRHLAEACREAGSRLLQVSTDYVFHGSVERTTPFKEDDTPNPQGAYARSKFEAEQVAMAVSENSLVVRTCGLYVNRGDEHIRNFAKTMLRLAGERPTLRVVADQQCAPSYVPHVACAILFLAERAEQGVMHVVNSGATTWYGFAVELFRQAGLAVQVEPITTAEYPTSAARPPYSVLDSTRYASLGGPALPSWQQGIADFLAINEA